MRRPLLVAVLAGSLLVGCSDQTTEVSAPPAALAPALDVGPVGCSLNNLLDLTRALFPPSPTLNLIIATLKALPTRPQLRLSAAIRAKVFGIIDLVTKAYAANRLAGGQSALTQTRLLAFLNGLYCFVGLPAPAIPLGALDPNEGRIVVVTPTSGNTLVQTRSKHGGIFIPAGAAPTTTTVTISGLPDSPGPLLTSLDQYPLFYEFSSSPAVTFTSAVTTAVCLKENYDIEVARLAHNVGPLFGDVEVLPPASAAGVVDCIDLAPVSSRWGSPRDLFAAAFLPTELHASSTALALATTGVGGTTRKFSPFGTVDAASNPGSLSVGAGVPLSSFVLPGATVSPSPAVVVRSMNGTPIPNVPVTFAVGDGGSVNGGSSQTVQTNANGIATATGWVPGTGVGSYVLTATPPAGAQVGSVEPYQPAVAFAPSSLTFTSTVVGPIEYGAAGYRYLILPEGAPPEGFEDAAFDDSSWLTGTAAFGFNDPLNSCALIVSDTRTAWPANTQILVRRRFTIPGGGSTGVVRVAIDNDIRVFVNGIDITSSAGAVMDGGFAQHDGCPTANSLTFTATGLDPGVNLLVIQARDRGGSSFLDASVEASEVSGD
ncbi:MAG: hypothetical protein M3Q93_08145 [Gemmatimonadota bacterium]|nr:hypothetical protein [Gemmatimonadota bacterium]